MFRRGLRAVRRLPPSALIVPTTLFYQSACGYSYAATAAASQPGAVSAAQRLGLPSDLAGLHAWSVSSASYPANDPIEDRWTVARIPLPPPPASPKPGSRDAWAPLSSLAPAAAAAASTAEPPSVLLAAVMDGHGGWQASDYVQAHIAGVLTKELAHAADPRDPEQLAAALSRTFERLDRDFIARVKPAFEIGFGEVARVGCCALAAIVTPTHVVVANAGDCRAVYGRVSHAPPSPPAAVDVDDGAALPGQRAASSGSSKGFVSAQAAHAFSSGGGAVGRDADLPPFLRQGAAALPLNGSYSSPSASLDGDDGGNGSTSPTLLSSSPHERAEVEAAAAIEREEGRRMVQRLRWAAQSARGSDDAPAAGADTGPLARLIAVISGLTRGNGVVGPPAGLGGTQQRGDGGADYASLPQLPGLQHASAADGAAVAFSPFGLGASPLGSHPPLQVEAVPLSDDHNARIPREQAALRLMHPGEDDVVYLKPGSGSAWYVKARLQPTRAIGDAYLKHSEFNAPPGQRARGRHIPPPYTPPYISSKPETRILALPVEAAGGGSGSSGNAWSRTSSSSTLPSASSASAGGSVDSGSSLSPTIVLPPPPGVPSSPSSSESFLILACDGVWDVMTNAEAVRFVAEDGGDPATVADRLVGRVLEMEAAAAHLDVAQLQDVPPGRRRRQLHDDLTAIVVRLGAGAGGGGSGLSPSVARRPGSPAGGGGAGLWGTLSSWLGSGGGAGGGSAASGAGR